MRLGAIHEIAAAQGRMAPEPAEVFRAGMDAYEALAFRLPVNMSPADAAQEIAVEAVAIGRELERALEEAESLTARDERDRIVARLREIAREIEGMPGVPSATLLAAAARIEAGQ